MGVWLALFVVVSRPLGRLMALVFEVDESYGQQLLSKLVILSVVLTILQMRKRYEARADARTAAVAAEKAARFALGDTGLGSVEPPADICFPMIAAGKAVGVFAVASEPALSEAERNVVTAAASLLAVSLKNAQRFHALLELPCTMD